MFVQFHFSVTLPPNKKPPKLLRRKMDFVTGMDVSVQNIFNSSPWRSLFVDCTMPAQTVDGIIIILI
jgi:hypothetical protein